MRLSAHFTAEEFTASDTAVRRGIDNSLPASMLVTATSTCEMLERIRDHLCRVAGHDVPLILTSGYRCQELNAAIGSTPGSDHPRAMAADIKAPAFGSPYEVACELATHVSELDIGQLIHEFGSWVHVSTRRPDKQLNRIITISKAGTEVGILEVA
jgi:zinc D-Ala-D-Ala carboxypeptidase